MSNASDTIIIDHLEPTKHLIKSSFISIRINLHIGSLGCPLGYHMSSYSASKSPGWMSIIYHIGLCSYHACQPFLFLRCYKEMTWNNFKRTLKLSLRSSSMLKNWTICNGQFDIDLHAGSFLMWLRHSCLISPCAKLCTFSSSSYNQFSLP